MKKIRDFNELMIRETREERAERIKYASTMQTKVMPNKKRYSRAEFKKFDIYY